MDAAIRRHGRRARVRIHAGKRARRARAEARAHARAACRSAVRGFDTSTGIPEQVFATGKNGDRRPSRGEPGRLRTSRRSHTASATCCACRCSSCGKWISQAPIESRPTGVLLSRQPREGDARCPQTTRTHSKRSPRRPAVAIEDARLYREAVEKGAYRRRASGWRPDPAALLPKARTRGSFYDASGRRSRAAPSAATSSSIIDLPDGSFGFALGDVSGKGAAGRAATADAQGCSPTQAFAPVEPATMMTRVKRGPARAGHREPLRDDLLCDSQSGWPSEKCTQRGSEPATAVQRSRRQKTGDGRHDRRAVPGCHLRAGRIAAQRRRSAGRLPSDGVSEALNPQGEIATSRGSGRWFHPNWLEPSDAVLQSLLESVRGFAQGRRQNDDVTALVVRYATPEAVVVSTRVSPSARRFARACR